MKTTREVKDRIRAYIDAHFTGSEYHSNDHRRVANASAQERFYDDIESKGQYAGLVYSKFGKRDAGGFVDFLLLHVRGGTVRPRSGEWLRIAAGDGAGSGPSIAQTGFFPLSSSDIFFTRSPDGKRLYQLRRYRKSGLSGKRGTTQLIATLVKQVIFPARLSGIEEIARSRADLFEGHFAEALGLHEQKQGKT